MSKTVYSPLTDDNAANLIKLKYSKFIYYNHRFNM